MREIGTHALNVLFDKKLLMKFSHDWLEKFVPMPLSKALGKGVAAVVPATELPPVVVDGASVEEPVAELMVFVLVTVDVDDSNCRR